ncbi:MAG TPA: TRAP transporter small permease [Alphaproteobacteria bacterium]|jgi:C4-dicarboxylate transporter DctQ subunit
MPVIARAYGAVFGATGVVAILCIAAMALLITVDVLSRYFGFGSLGFALEAVEYCIFLSAFFGAPWILYHNAHVTVDFLLRALPRRVTRVLEIAADLLGLLTTAIVLFYIGRVGFASWSEGMRIIRSFIFPEWWLFVAAGFCLLLVVIEFACRLWRAAHGRAAAAETPSF